MCDLHIFPAAASFFPEPKDYDSSQSFLAALQPEEHVEKSS